MCKNIRERNELYSLLQSNGVNVSRFYIIASNAWDYLSISKKLHRIGLYTRYRSSIMPHKIVNLKIFMDLFKTYTMINAYTIYGEKIMFDELNAELVEANAKTKSGK